MGLINSTKHFSETELRCKCGQCEPGMDIAFMEKLELVRAMVRFPMIITSAHRCPAYNAKVSKTGETGPHTLRRAVDIKVMGNRSYDIIHVGVTVGMTGIGVSQKGEHGSRFIHLDDLRQDSGHPRPWVWSY